MVVPRLSRRPLLRIGRRQWIVRRPPSAIAGRRLRKTISRHRCSIAAASRRKLHGRRKRPVPNQQPVRKRLVPSNAKRRPSASLSSVRPRRPGRRHLQLFLVRRRRPPQLRSQPPQRQLFQHQRRPAHRQPRRSRPVRKSRCEFFASITKKACLAWKPGRLFRLRQAQASSAGAP